MEDCALYSRQANLRTTFEEKLLNSSYYLAAIERLHIKFSTSHRSIYYEEEKEGYSFSHIYNDRKKIAKILAKDVSKKRYHFSPATLVNIITDGKRRTIFSYTLIDRIVHGALHTMLAEDLAALVSTSVYSYVKGKSRYNAISDLLTYTKQHRLRHRKPQDRGMYVYRSDIKSYGESIPVLPSSPLWQQLNCVFQIAYGAPMSLANYDLLTALIRPSIANKDGSLYEFLFGIPDGAPVSSLLLNLYVVDLDKVLANIEGGFYARYGDDFIFAHENHDVFIRVTDAIPALLSGLQLSANAKKTQRFFYNGAGRHSNALKGSSLVNYLGMVIDFNGATWLKKEKIELMMRDLALRMKASSVALKHKTIDDQGKLLCAIVNNFFDTKEPFSHPYANFFRFVVNDRTQLKQMDYRVARLVLKYLTNDTSVKKFRQISYRKMRQEWKLVSLVRARNAT